MVTNNTSTSMILGLGAAGLALVVAGVGLIRRHRAGEAVGSGGAEQGVEAELMEDRAAQTQMQPSAAQGKLPLDYFALVTVLAVPFWLFGGGKLPLPINLPVGALATFVPVTAAAILTYRQNGIQGVKELFQKAVDFKKVKNRLWYLPALFIMPLIGFLSYVAMRLTGLPLPDSIRIPLLVAPVFFVMFLIGDTGEELGWTGYALDPLQNRWGAFKASLILGIVWVIWHTIPWVQTGNAAAWILWQGLFSIAARILMVWIYNNTGKSVFAANLVHVTSNLGWALFPNYGSHYNPFVTGVITLLLTGIVLLGWDSKTLARPRFARLD